MPNLKSRLERIETSKGPPDHEPITEIHRYFVGPDGTRLLDGDGKPKVLVRKVDPGR